MQAHLTNVPLMQVYVCLHTCLCLEQKCAQQTLQVPPTFLSAFQNMWQFPCDKTLTGTQFGVGEDAHPEVTQRIYHQHWATENVEHRQWLPVLLSPFSCQTLRTLLSFIFYSQDSSLEPLLCMTEWPEVLHSALCGWYIFWAASGDASSPTPQLGTSQGPITRKLPHTLEG